MSEMDITIKKKKEMEITIGKRAKRKVKDFQRSATFWIGSLNIIVIKELKMDF